MMPKLEYMGRIYCAVGARGFYGEGYPFHRWWKYLGMDWEGMVLAAKTGTMSRVVGNMPLGKDGITPLELEPACIFVEPITGHMLNAVGLSNPGYPFLLEKGIWQTLPNPFCLSFMAMSETKEERLEETREFVALLSSHLPFRSAIALQFNCGCPNAGHDLSKLIDELGETFELAADLRQRYGISLIANFSVAASPEAMIETALLPLCDGLWIANTVRFGHPAIDCRGIFGTDTSPMILRGFDKEGGISGPACLPLAIDRVMAVRAELDIPIIAGNGIQRPQDVVRMFAAGADAVAVGCVAIVRPWRMRAITRAACSAQTWRENHGRR